MWTLILILLTVNGDKIEVNLHTEAPSQKVCLMDQSTMAQYLGDHPDKKLHSWRCENVNKIRTAI